MPHIQIIVSTFLLLIVFPAWAGNINSDLLTAARNGKTASVQALLAKGADVKARDVYYGQTALMFAGI